MSPPDVEDIVRTAADEKREVSRDLRQTFLSGLALTVPFFITLLVLMWTLNAVTDVISPLVEVLTAVGPAAEMYEPLAELLAATIVFGVILAVGFAARHGPETNLGERVDAVMEDLPGLGSIYTGVERMSDVLVEGNTDSFREVKLVEFPRSGSYAIAFLTASTRRSIEKAAGEEDMVTVFVPMAPNPVMGGHLLNLPRERVHDVDLSVEEGMEAIMTTGLAIDETVTDEAT